MASQEDQDVHNQAVPQERSENWMNCQWDVASPAKAVYRAAASDDRMPELFLRLDVHEDKIRRVLEEHAQRVEDILQEGLDGIGGGMRPFGPLASKQRSKEVLNGISATLQPIQATQPSTRSNSQVKHNVSLGNGHAHGPLSVPQTDADGPPLKTIHSQQRERQLYAENPTSSRSRSGGENGSSSRPLTSARSFHVDAMNQLGTAANKVVAPSLVRKNGVDDGPAVDSTTFRGRQRQRIRTIASSSWFEMLISVSIVFNVLTIAAKSDARMRDPKNADDISKSLVYADLGCTVIFFIEICMRLYASGCRWFFNYQKNMFFKWNVLDFVLVLCALFESLAVFIEMRFFDISGLRLIGLGRLVRIIPSARVLRSFSDLRVMLLSITFGLSSVFWAALVLFFHVLLISIFIMECLVLSLSTSNYSPEVVDELDKMFGTLWKSLYTVYSSITGGLDWVSASDVLLEVSSAYGFFYVVCIAFAQLCILNVLTGVFVKNASDVAQRDEDTMMLYELEKRRVWVNQVVRVFEEANHDGTGTINRDQFVEALTQVRIQLLLRKLGIDIWAHSPHSLFTMFDYDGNGTLEISEFASALHNLHGNARSLDVAKVKFAIKKFEKKFREFEHWALGLEDNAAAMERLMNESEVDDVEGDVKPHQNMSWQSAALAKRLKNQSEPVRGTLAQYSL
mmetsp:Transcript_47855/g.113710  ORF Transcript_47855/g.113710 Transcript_47855/m.113710 type:complete len:681 (+) Transcript_47855:118-2160(+)